MPKKRHTPNQIIEKLRQADRLLGQNMDMGQVCRQMEISEQTYYRWRKMYGGMKAPEMKRLKALEKENLQLKKLVAEQALDIQMLKYVAEGNF